MEEYIDKYTVRGSRTSRERVGSWGRSVSRSRSRSPSPTLSRGERGGRSPSPTSSRSEHGRPYVEIFSSVGHTAAINEGINAKGDTITFPIASHSGKTKKRTTYNVQLPREKSAVNSKEAWKQAQLLGNEDSAAITQTDVDYSIRINDAIAALREDKIYLFIMAVQDRVDPDFRFGRSGGIDDLTAIQSFPKIKLPSDFDKLSKSEQSHIVHDPLIRSVLIQGKITIPPSILTHRDSALIAIRKLSADYFAIPSLDELFEMIVPVEEPRTILAELTARMMLETANLPGNRLQYQSYNYTIRKLINEKAHEMVDNWYPANGTMTRKHYYVSTRRSRRYPSLERQTMTYRPGTLF